jgi:ribonuclease/clavin/mitogillin
MLLILPVADTSLSYLLSILTHRHHDHVGGLPSVLELLSQTQSEPPRLHKFSDPATDEALFARLKQLPSNVYQSHKALDGPVPIRPLQEGDVISVGEDTSEAEATAKATAVQVVHSPGHTTDSICLYFSPEKALFTADHVLGQGTSVFENLGSYLSSLTKCLNLLQKNSASEQEERLLYPGHGPVIETGKKALQDYLSHRLERENQVLALLAKQPSNSKDGGSEKEGGWTIEAIVSELYSNYPEHLYPAAARGIFLHLEKLASPDEEAIQRGVVGRQKQGRRVECVGTAAGKDGMTPKMPSGDSEWFHIMELKWRLLDQTV